MRKIFTVEYVLPNSDKPHEVHSTMIEAPDPGTAANHVRAAFTSQAERIRITNVTKGTYM